MAKKPDPIQMYMGDDWIVNKFITIRQPTIGEIIEMGEQEYWSTVFTITSIPSDMKSQLDDMGVDYEEISDFQLFIMLTKGLNNESSKILFGDLDFTQFQVAIDEENEGVILVQEKNGEHIIIDEYLYNTMISYIREMHGIKPKIEKALNKYTKKLLIDLDRQDRSLKKDKPYESKLLPMISSLCNSSGFKYKKNEMREVGIVEFMDSLNRISTIKTSDALLRGIYGGMIDTSKIDKKELNWARQL